MDHIINSYEEWTDFEINKAVAIALGRYLSPPKGCEVEIVGDVECFYDDMRVLWDCHFNYCDSPNDAWPIITENNISIIHIPIIGVDKHRYSASIGAEFMTVCMSPDGSDNGVLTFRDDYNYIDENNPLRAAMIVFLKMQENTND